ncbi:hypothetical protein D0Y65_004062 [Glycine soja]|uniref:Uncharacterized protein n=1 Tax=Glycine soja TaxID=3848 RepID=A0A445LPK7_GLYSO|nr:hypothetical protein D0Y65_004062 [Glycine soja]
MRKCPTCGISQYKINNGECSDDATINNSLPTKMAEKVMDCSDIRLIVHNGKFALIDVLLMIYNLPPWLCIKRNKVIDPRRLDELENEAAIVLCQMEMVMRTPPPSLPQLDVQSEAMFRNTRQSTQLRRLTLRTLDQPRPIVNIDAATGQGPGSHKEKFHNYLGVVAREKIPIEHKNWKDVPDSLKDLVWDDILLNDVAIDDPLRELIKSMYDIYEKPVQLVWDVTKFGIQNVDASLFLTYVDVNEIISGEKCLNITILQLWMMYMDEWSSSLGHGSMYGFLEPQSIHNAKCHTLIPSRDYRPCSPRSAFGSPGPPNNFKAKGLARLGELTASGLSFSSLGRAATAQGGILPINRHPRGVVKGYKERALRWPYQMHAKARVMSEIEEVQEQMKADMEAMKEKMTTMMEAMMSMRKMMEASTTTVTAASTTTKVDPAHPSSLNQVNSPVSDMVGQGGITLGCTGGPYFVQVQSKHLFPPYGLPPNSTPPNVVHAPDENVNNSAPIPIKGRQPQSGHA